MSSPRAGYTSAFLVGSFVVLIAACGSTSVASHTSTPAPTTTPDPASTSLTAPSGVGAGSPNSSVATSGRGTGTLIGGVDLCSVVALQTLLQTIYQETGQPVSCVPKELLPVDTPYLASGVWYFATINESGPEDSKRAHISVEIFADHTQFTPHYWQNQLTFLQSMPDSVKAAGQVNGVPALWLPRTSDLLPQSELLTPFGSVDDVQVTVFDNADGTLLANDEQQAKDFTALAERSAFR
jgi:hypothetical protein